MTTVPDIWSAVADLVFAPEDPDAWKPLPHQVPPSGVPGADWTLWLLLGGRGTGKTDASAHYVNEHVMGPPCDPRVPGGHRIAIIAPTQGDAMDSCVTGPSGLKAHNPDIKSVTKAGGTYVYWPNGAEAKLFGAYTPQDVERLRAGGNRCLAAGTLIATSSGPVAIENVTPGMLVYTRNGLRRVLRAAQTDVRRCVTLTAGGYSIRCTPDHLIWAGDEWKQASVVNRIATWDSKSFNGTDRVGTSERTCTSATAEGVSSIGRFGPSATDLSPQECRSTTSTTTRAITQWRTLYSALPLSTGMSTMTREVLTGTVRVVRQQQRGALTSSANVITAAPFMWDERPLAGIAQTAAVMSLPLHERSANGCALCAATSSPPLDGVRPALVATRVEHSTSQPSSDPEPVYDLLVEHDHEFFANGILVANCLCWVEELAAWRQLTKSWPHMRYGLRIGPRPHIIGSTTPKPRKFLLKLVNDPRTVTTHGTTDDNPHLASTVREELYKDYAGTRLGRQELQGEFLGDVQGAIATLDELDEARVWEVPKLDRTVVSVDPAVTNTEDSDETGITVSGRAGAHVFFIADYSVRADVGDWAFKAIEAGNQHKAGMILYEANQGSDAVGAVLKHALEEFNEKRSVSYRPVIRAVTAKMSKFDRALPLQQAIQQGRYHLFGSWPKYEEQLTTWVQNMDEAQDDDLRDKKGKRDKSPDRLDSGVHGFRELMGIGGRGRTSGRQLQQARVST